jgi:hypothetical protein
MKYSFNKYITICSLLLFVFISCTKEGLPGPEGEQGPAGEDATGGGASGAATKVISYNTPPGTVLTWEAMTGGKFRLKFTAATHSGYSFTLPDSVTKYIDEGSLLVYAEQGDNNRAGWFELPLVPAEFYDISQRAYTLERIAGTGYRLSFFVYGPHAEELDRLRFVVIPKTSSYVLN